MQNRMTVFQNWISTFFCILVCVSLVLALSGCMFPQNQLEAPPTAGTQPAPSETQPHSTAAETEAPTEPLPTEPHSTAAETEAPTEPLPTTQSEEETQWIPENLPADASAYNGHYYKIYLERVDWDIARQNCIDLGGHLATITDAEEQAFIEELNQASNRLWIGGLLVDNQWRWVTEEAFEYTDWKKGEPNNSSNVIPHETKVSVWPKEWNDLNSASREQSGYICEWDGLPDVTAEAPSEP